MWGEFTTSSSESEKKTPKRCCKGKGGMKKNMRCIGAGRKGKKAQVCGKATGKLKRGGKTNPKRGGKRKNPKPQLGEEKTTFVARGGGAQGQ